MRHFFWTAIFFLMLVSTKVFAKGVSPYLPLNLAPEVELQLQKLVALTGNVPLSKPYKATELINRLPLIKDNYPILHSRLTAYLKRYTQNFAITHRGITLSTSDENARTLENNRGIEHDTSVELSAGAHIYFSPYVYVAAGGMFSDESGRAATNSHIGFGNQYIQVDLGYREHWYSPFQDSAMLVSTNAENAPSITLSNSTPISDWHIRYELFHSRLDDVRTRSNEIRTTIKNPSITGAHLSFSPIEMWSLGFSHTQLHGGRDSSMQQGDIISFPPISPEAGNLNNTSETYKQFALSSQWQINWVTPISLYAEFANADTRDENGIEYDTNARSFGFFLPSIFQNMSLRYEYTDRDSGWYQNFYYPEGYSNKGHILGHWSADEFDNRTAPGAKTHHLLMDWELIDNQIIAVRVSGQEVENMTNLRVQDTYQLKTRYSFANRYGFWGVEGTYGKDAFGDFYHRLSGFFRW